jgi:peptidoglycan lytic transglycosylase
VLRRVNTYLNLRWLTLAAVAAAGLLLPALGSADTGGSGGGGVGPTTTTQSGNRTVSASANGVTITTRASGFMGKNLTFSGSAPSSDSGKVVEIQRSGRHTGGRWVGTSHATIGSDGSFTAYWKSNRPGPLAFRAVLRSVAASTARSSWPTVDVVVYRMAIATIYGPGFWGSKTACGETLHRTTLGVAHRTLPCGTRVSIYYDGRTMVVPVIDRGPYANGADWDLTVATARALGMDTTSRVGGATMPRN